MLFLVFPLTMFTIRCLSDTLEQAQRSFCKILFPMKSYEWSLENLNLKALHEQMIMLSKRTAVKMSKNDKFKSLFPKVNQINTRSRRVYKEPKWKSIRYGSSAIPFFIRLLNGEDPLEGRK